MNVEDLTAYYFGCEDWMAEAYFENISRLFISHQCCYLDMREEFIHECLLY